MSTCENVHVPIHYIEALTDKIEAVHDRITQRAYEQWLTHRVPGDTIAQFWSVAERELFCQPNTEIREWAHGILIEITCTDVNPAKIRLFMSPTEVLLLAPMNVSEVDRWLFRYVRFEKSMD